MNHLSLMDSENEEYAAALRQLLGLYANPPRRRLPVRWMAFVTACWSRCTAACRNPARWCSPADRASPRRWTNAPFPAPARGFSAACWNAFLPALVSINSFTEFTLKSQQRAKSATGRPVAGKGRWYE